MYNIHWRPKGGHNEAFLSRLIYNFENFNFYYCLNQRLINILT